MSTVNRVVKNSLFLYMKMGITMFVSLYTTRVILNSLGAADYGIFNVVGGAINTLGFLSATMAGVTQRFMSFALGQEDLNKQKQVFNISLALHLATAAIMVVVLTSCGWIFFHGILTIPEDRINAAIVVYGCLIFSTAMTIVNVPYDAIMNAHENMFYYSIVGILESLLKLAVALACLHTSSDKLVVYGFLMACIPIVTLTIMKIYCHKKYQECSISIKKYWNINVAKQMGTFAGWNFCSTASMMIANYGLAIVTNAFYGVILNTALALAQQVDALLKVFSNNMLKALNPVIVKSAGAGNKNAFLVSTIAGSKFSFYMFAIFSIPFFIEAPYILKIWLSNVPDWAVLFCRLQIIASLFSQCTVTFSTTIGANGNIKGFSIGTSILYISSICLTAFFFRMNFPPYIMYVSVILLNVIGYQILELIVVKRIFCMAIINMLKGTFYPCLLVFVATFTPAFCVSTNFESSGLRLIISCILCLISFVISLNFFGLTTSERTAVYSLLKSITNRFR